MLWCCFVPSLSCSLPSDQTCLNWMTAVHQCNSTKHNDFAHIICVEEKWEFSVNIDTNSMQISYSAMVSAINISTFAIIRDCWQIRAALTKLLFSSYSPSRQFSVIGRGSDCIPTFSVNVTHQIFNMRSTNMNNMDIIQKRQTTEKNKKKYITKTLKNSECHSHLLYCSSNAI